LMTVAAESAGILRHRARLRIIGNHPTRRVCPLDPVRVKVESCVSELRAGHGNHPGLFLMEFRPRGQMNHQKKQKGISG
jgi:hypothetical protein